jgi:hypothetical protein
MQDVAARGMQIANTPYQQSPGTYTGPNDYLQAGWQATANRAMQGSPTMDAANQTLQKTLNGGFLNGNPYLDQQVSAAQGDLVKSWNQVAKPQWDMAMRNSGSFGNTGVAQSAAFGADTLQQNLGRVANDMRFNAYNTERGYQQNALGMAPTYAQQDYNDANALLQVGGQAQAFDQAQQNQNQQWFQEAQQYPAQQLNQYLAALGMNAGGTQTQTAPDPSKASQVIGGAITGASLLDLLFPGSRP